MEETQKTTEQYWQRKLLALLHDSPDKCFDIANHEEMAKANIKAAGLTVPAKDDPDSKIAKRADHFASAADRFCFPARSCPTAWDGQPGSTFIHPLDSSNPSSIPEGIRERSKNLSGILQAAIKGVDETDYRKKHFLYWRLWMENASRADERDAQVVPFLPGDSRIPDHSIWNHTAVTSAVAGAMAGNDPNKYDKDCPNISLLLFQLGPVQSFIAQARSTRDLWSGSYLLSWLMAHAMKAVSDKCGPDSMIFPSLRGNGIFDVLHRDEMYSTPFNDGKGGTDTHWERMCQDKGNQLASWICTPTLPNRFLAIVPKAEAENLAKAAEEAIHSELKQIGEAVWEWIMKHGAKKEWKQRWNAQIAVFPQITYAFQDWLPREKCLAALRKLPRSEGDALENLEALLKFAESPEVFKRFPENDRGRYYGSDKKLSNSGVFWSAHYALLDAKLAARRNTRNFDAWDSVADQSKVKDSLSGVEECIGDEEFWKELYKNHSDIFTTPRHHYGAMNLIKRLWCRSDVVPYLFKKWGIEEAVFKKTMRFDSVQDVAGCNEDSKNPYVAILAFDGDEMGKWVSGAKMPFLKDQVSQAAKDYLQGFEGHEKIKRPLSPSYHLQFSEALANFAVLEADKIVRNYQGQLIYAGGDDVLAMLPATKAIACASKLREVFRTSYRKTYILPGEKTDVSVGLAIGHCKAPLQMLVREAQAAEKRAKTYYGRAALAVSLYKRSGEIIHWGAKWETNAISLMEMLTPLTSEGKLSSRFPYALASLLRPYQLQGKMEGMSEIMMQEVDHALSRQGEGLQADDKNKLREAIEDYLISTKEHLEDFINLFMTETFINRNRGENENE